MKHVLGLVWLAAGCSRDWCGSGTIERDRQCVALPEEPTAPPALQCGPGTVEVDGVCTAEEVIATCGLGTILREDTCVALDLQIISMPFAEGSEVGVMQGNHGYFSHTGSSVYAIDWDVPEGTEVVAVRGGLVLDLYEQSDSGCAEAACADQANYVVIDHGDGTFGQYWHLQQGGALVEVGDLVGRGEVIGLSGNTGWSTDPHLHLQVRDPLGQSLPLFFEDQPETGGMVFAGASFRSGNTPQPPPSDLGWSSCPEDLFSFLGITLGPGVPCARVEGSSLVASGEVGVSGADVMIATWSTPLASWRYLCADGPSFDEQVSLPQGTYQGHTWLAVSAASASCYSFQGWDSSVYLTLAP